MRVFLENAEGFEFFEFVKMLVFGEAFVVQGIADFAGWTKIKNENCNNTHND